MRNFALFEKDKKQDGGPGRVVAEQENSSRLIMVSNINASNPTTFILNVR